MFGSDSAPHPQSAKENCGCAAGVFTAPIALQVLVELFEKHDKLDNLQKFISDNAQKIYNFTPSEKEVVLEKKTFNVPDIYGKVVPMYAGEELKWSIKSIS
jgi:dihydroorotase